MLNTALMSALSGISFRDAIKDRQYWGRLTESAVGAHLVNEANPVPKVLFLINPPVRKRNIGIS